MAAQADDIVGIRSGPVGEWLTGNIPGARGPFSYELLAGGHSNLTYKVTGADGTPYVLRRPPTGAVLATAHDMAREHRIISAVGRTAVPVAPALGLCADPEVNDAPFYVMGYVAGVVLDGAEKVDAHFPHGEQRRQIGDSVIEVMAALHTADPDACGLGDLGRRDAYLERQIKRWRTQWENSKTRELPTMERVADALEAHMPAQVGSGIVHGDYRLGNMMIGADARIAAVLDWELCTLGDVMADLGFIMNNWAAPGEPQITTRGLVMPPTEAGGFCSREEFLARYQERTGRDVSGVDYYRAFQYWRLAAIIEGVLARYLKGVMGVAQADTETEVFRTQVAGLADAALDLIRAWG